MSITTIRNSIAAALDELNQIHDLQPELDDARRQLAIAKANAADAARRADETAYRLAMTLQGMLAKGSERERADAATALRAAGYIVPGEDNTPRPMPTDLVGLAAELRDLEERRAIARDAEHTASNESEAAYRGARKPYLEALAAFAPVRMGDVIVSTSHRFSDRHSIRVDKIRCLGYREGSRYGGPKGPHLSFEAEGWVVRKDGKQGQTRKSADLYVELPAMQEAA